MGQCYGMASARNVARQRPGRTRLGAAALTYNGRLALRTFPMKNTKQFHRDRRSALIKAMREHSGGGLALIPTAPEVTRNRDALFPFRPDSYFYYLSGFREPEAVVALVASPDGDRHILFCREKNDEREIWDGFRYGPDAAREMFGFDEAYPFGELDAKLPELASDHDALHTPLGLFEPLGPPHHAAG